LGNGEKTTTVLRESKAKAASGLDEGEEIKGKSV